MWIKHVQKKKYHLWEWSTGSTIGQIISWIIYKANLKLYAPEISYGMFWTITGLSRSLPVKIAEKAVNVQLQQHLHHHGLLNLFQSGCRLHHLTQTAVTYFYDTIRRSTDAGKLTGALFIDLKYAFATVPHDDLICKPEGLVWRKTLSRGWQAT